MNVRHEPKTALVTGAVSTIGNELTRLFAQDGYNLVLISNSKEELSEFKNELEDKYSIYVKLITKDLSLETSPEEIFKETKAEQIYIDTLVNNAGFILQGSFLESDFEKEFDLIQVNIKTLIYLTKLYASEMAKKGFGRILNVSSTEAFKPKASMAVYSASKAFILNFSEALSAEFKNYGITVTTLCPDYDGKNIELTAEMNKNLSAENGQMLQSDYIAKQGYEALKSGKTIIVPGKKNRLFSLGIKLLPHSIRTRTIKVIHETSN